MSFEKSDLYGYFQFQIYSYMASQFRRVERRPVTPEVVGSSPIGVASKNAPVSGGMKLQQMQIQSLISPIPCCMWGSGQHHGVVLFYGPVALIGRAPDLHSGGCGFKSRLVHHNSISKGKKRDERCSIGFQGLIY